MRNSKNNLIFCIVNKQQSKNITCKNQNYAILYASLHIAYLECVKNHNFDKVETIKFCLDEF